MKVSFPVYGQTVDELESEAVRILELFGPGRRWVHTVEARVAEQSGTTILVWQGDVEAECPT